MALIVQKFGGSSVANIERIENVARKVIASRDAGNQVVVVVSAMKGETDRLTDLAHAAAQTSNPRPRELDLLLSTGETVTIALLTMVLERLGAEARCYTGAQVQILTDSAFSKARIQEIDAEPIREDLGAGALSWSQASRVWMKTDRSPRLAGVGRILRPSHWPRPLRPMSVRFTPMWMGFTPRIHGGAYREKARSDYL